MKVDNKEKTVASKVIKSLPVIWLYSEDWGGGNSKREWDGLGMKAKIQSDSVRSRDRKRRRQSKMY